MPKAFTYEEATEPAKFSFEEAQPEPHGYEPEPGTPAMPIPAPQPVSFTGPYGVPMEHWGQPIVKVPPKVPETLLRGTMYTPSLGQLLRVLPKPKREEVIKGISESAASQASSLTSPEGLGIAAAAAVMPEVAIPALVAYGETQLPAAIEELDKAKTPEEQAKAATDIAGVASMIVGPVLGARGKGRQPPKPAPEKPLVIEPPAEPAKAPESELVTDANAKALPNAAKEVEKPLEQPAAPAAQTERAPDASSIKEATKVHGDVRPLVEPASPLPVKEGGEGVQPQATGGLPKAEEAARPAQGAFLLTPAVQAEGQTFTGKSHAEAVVAAARKGVDATKAQHVFLDAQGKVLNRKKAAEIFEAATGKAPANAEGLHSEDLRDAGLLEAKATPLAPGAREGAAAEAPKPSAGSAGTSATGAGIAAPEPARQPTVTPGQQKSQAAAAGAGKEPPRVARGVTQRMRFAAESEFVGEDILSWIVDNMPILSKTGAKSRWGSEKFKANSGLYDDAPSRLGAPHHNIIYSVNGRPPDVVAQALYEAGKISSPDVGEMWNAIDAASKGRIGTLRKQKAELRWLEREAKLTEEWEAGLSKEKGKTELTSDDLKVGDVIEVAGEKFEATDVDPDTGQVTLKDGRKFGVQTLPSGKQIYVEDYIEVTPEKFEPEAAPEPAKPKPGGELLPPSEIPFNLVRETAPEVRPEEAKTGYGTETLSQQEMFGIQQITKLKDPGKSADAAQQMYGGPEKAAKVIERQLAIIDTDKATKKAYGFDKQQRQRLSEVLALLRQRATPMPPGPGAGRGEAGLGAAIVPGGKEFLEQDLVPFAQRLSQGIRQTASQIRRNFAPASVSPEAGLAAGVIRERAAELAQRDVQMRDQFHKQLKEWDHLSQPASLDFIDRVETGAAQPTMPLQTLSAELRNQFDRRVAEVRALGTGKLQHVITDYFPHIWKDADAAISWYARIMGKRPLRGPGSFLKHRSIPTTREGVNAGLEPVTWNPVELSLLKMHEIDRYIMGQKIFQELKDKGLAKFTRSGIPPDGFAVINDRIANVVEYRPTVKADGTPGSPERILRGHWYAQKDAAAVLNNFLSPGLEKFAWYRALRWMGNTLNMAQLGFSGYHGMFTMIDAGTSKLSLGIEQAARGEKVGPLTMGRGLAGTLVGNQVEAYVKGSKVLQEYTKPGSVGGDYVKIVDALVASGGRVQMPRIYKNSSLENFFAASRKGNLLGAAVRAPFAAIEAVSYPLMQNIVPRLKLGVFTDMAKAEIERMGPNVSREEFRRNMGKVWDSVDNRMGELVYDNLFWNRTLKDLSFLMVRAVGWNLGTIRELGGGVMDAATFWKRIGSGDPIVTKRMAYTMALPFTVGLMGAMYQYMKTGQPPEELRDYFYPKTGQTLPDGTVERVNFPSYLKDIVSYSRHPLTTVGHKLHPMWSSTVDMLNNKDFYGVQIRNKDDPVMQQLHQVARFVAGSYVPFSVKGSTRRVGSETSLETKAESFFGIMPISPELARTPAQNKIMEYAVAKMPRGARTPEEEQRVELVRDVQKSMLSPADQEQARAKLRQAQAAGTLTKGQRLYQQNKLRFITRQMNQGRTKTEALWLWRFDHLPVDEAQHVYELANPDEKKLFERPLALKIRRMGRTTPRTDTE